LDGGGIIVAYGGSHEKRGARVDWRIRGNWDLAGVFVIGYMVALKKVRVYADSSIPQALWYI